MKKTILIIIAYFPLVLISAILGFLILDLLNWEKFWINYFHFIFVPIGFLFDELIKPLVEYLNKIDSFFKYWVYVFFTAMIWHFFIKKIPKWILSFFTIIFVVIKSILKIFIWFMFKNDKEVILFTTYLDFLNHYISKWNLKMILKTQLMFFKNIWNEYFYISDNELVVFKTYFEDKSKVFDLNSLIKRHINKDSYIRKNFVNYSWYIYFYISKWSLTWKELERRILDQENEIITYFWWGHNIKVSIENDKDIKVELIQKDLWINLDLDFKSVNLKEWEILLWFFPEITKKWIVYNNKTIFTKDMVHSFIIWATRSGKDVVLLNQVYSCLYNIKHFWNMELYFFDTKLIDWEYLDNLSSYWVKRYNVLEDYPKMFEDLEKEMDKRQKIIWIHSNIYNYNKSNPKSKMKEKVIIVNELLSLYTSLDKDKLQKISLHLNNLLAKGAWVGIKVILMSQTIRKDLSDSISKFLVNIQSRIILKIINPDEIEIISRGLSRENYLTIKSLKKHNALFVEDFEIKNEYKAYNLDQIKLLDWINKNFDKIDIFQDSIISDYHKYASLKWEISMKEAMWENFKLTRKDWDNMINQLTIDWKIDRENWWKYYFKK